MKKYSEKYNKDYAILKNAVIGFEFEAYYNVSYYKLLELLNAELKPVECEGFRIYHPDAAPTKNKFIITPDISGGSNMVELITGPLDYYTAKYYLLKIFNFIQKYGYTNEKSSIHINLSFAEGCGKEIGNLNILKEILTIDEDEIYRIFPSRKNNIYAKSIRKIIPFKQYDFSEISIDMIRTLIRIPEDKYYGINFAHLQEEKNKRIEFRYLGGQDYEKKTGEIIDIMDNFIINTWKNIGAGFDTNNIEVLREILEMNINSFSNFNTYDKFLVEFPYIQLQIDQNGMYDIINSYYPKIYEKLYTLIDCTENLKKCILNFVSTDQSYEIIDGEFKGLSMLQGFDFISCTITDGIFDLCEVVNCTVLNGELNKCMVYDSKITGSKMTACNVESSELNNIYFVNGMLNSHMEGGVFRSGQVGPYGSLSETTKVVNKEENFFRTSVEETGEKGKEIIKKQEGGAK
jgi:hypothetical protein